mgnify:CR=1
MSDKLNAENGGGVGSSAWLGCPNCGCQLIPVLSKAEPIGVDGKLKATCHQCGKHTERYDTQSDVLEAFKRGDWAS